MADWFLYLAKQDHAKTWVNGGRIPINPASNYLSDRTSGTTTPDEIVQHNVVNIDPAAHAALYGAGFTSSGTQTTILNGPTVIMPDGTRRIIQGHAQSGEEHTIILSFSRICERRLMRALADAQGNPKAAIVRIINPDLLLSHISDDIGIQGYCSYFNYTKGANRSHEIKGWSDRYMAEIRLYWPCDPAVQKWVDIPPGLAEHVELDGVPDVDPRLEGLRFEQFDEIFEPNADEFSAAVETTNPRLAPQMFSGIEFRGSGIVFDLRSPGDRAEPQKPGILLSRLSPPERPVVQNRKTRRKERASQRAFKGPHTWKR